MNLATVEGQTNLIGKVRKIAVEKSRPSTSQLITGVPPVTFKVGGQRGLVVKRPPGNQVVGGSNPTTAM